MYCRGAGGISLPSVPLPPSRRRNHTTRLIPVLPSASAAELRTAIVHTAACRMSGFLR